MEILNKINNYFILYFSFLSLFYSFQYQKLYFIYIFLFTWTLSKIMRKFLFILYFFLLRQQSTDIQPQSKQHSEEAYEDVTDSQLVSDLYGGKMVDYAQSIARNAHPRIKQNTRDVARHSDIVITQYKFSRATVSFLENFTIRVNFMKQNSSTRLCCQTSSKSDCPSIWFVSV